MPLLPISPAVKSHMPDPVAERGVPGDRAADPDLDVVGMRADRQEIDGAEVSTHRVQPKTSSALSVCPADGAGQDSRRHERAGNRVAAAAKREEVVRIVAVRADVHQAVRGLPVRQVPAVLRLQA